MKLRIKGNSLRFRLSRTEVSKLALSGYLEEQTSFGDNKLIYALQRIKEGDELSASFDKDKITMFVPASLIKGWPENDVVGFNTNMQLTSNNSLYLLLEKDFICLDETTEDQTDNYENPNKNC